MVTAERRRGIVSRVDVLAARFINTWQASFRMDGICNGNVVVRIDVMVIQIQRDLEIVGYAVFKLLTKIDDAIAAMFLLPAWRDPLLEFTVTFRRKIGGVSPRKDRFMRLRGRSTNQK